MADLRLNVDVDVHGEDKLHNLGGTLARGGAQLAKFAAVGVGAFAALGGVTSGFASDLNESLSKVDVVFGKNSQAIKDWSKSSASSLGLSQQKALEAAGTFGNLFSAMHVGEKPTQEMSTGLVELAADLASFNNIKPEEALEKLRAGIVGEAEPLRTLGIQISAARTEAKAMELGFKKVDGQFTASAKAQANYALIMEDSVKAQGDFNRTSDGMANQQRILAATFEDTMASIGQAFVPIIQELLPHVTDALKAFGGWVQDNMPAIKAVMGAVFGAIGTAISFLFTEVIPRLGQAFSWIATNIFPAVSNAGKGIGDTIGWIATNVIPPLISAFQSVVAWVKANWPTISSVFGQVFGAVANAVKVVWPIVERIATVLFPIVSTAASVLFKALDITFKAIGGIFEVVGNVASTVVTAIVGAWGILTTITKAIWDGIGSIIKGAINLVIDLVNSFLGFLNGISFGAGPWDVGPIHVDAISIDPFNVPLIPRLASGGIVNSPTLALLGERGPEAVVPLDRGGVMETHFHSHIEVTGQEPFIRNEDDLVRVNQRIAFLEGF